MTEYVKAVGSFPQWAQDLRQAGSSRLLRPDNVKLPALAHGKTSGDYSWHAQRGAAELLGLPSPSYQLSNLRTCIETVHDYWHGKMFTLRVDPRAMAQFIQDDMQFNLTNIPILSGCGLAPLDDDSKHTYGVLRPLITNFNCYIYAVEMKDALDRIDALDSATVKSGGQEVGREIEWIRQLASLLLEEAKVTIRLFWAAGPGKDLVKLSLDKPWHESTNIPKDIRLHLNKPLDEVEKESPFHAAFAEVCLNSDERGISYGPSEFTRLLAFEQATSGENDLRKKYPYATQMAMGEYTMALELSSELPPLTFPSVEPSKPKTFLVRLNVSQSASTQICTAIEFVTSMCNRDFAVENSIKLWETLKDIQGIFARELKLPNDLIDKLFPFMSDSPEIERWIPLDEFGKPLNGKGKERTGEKRKRDTFEVSKKDYKLWKKMFRGDDVVSNIDELSSLFRGIGFIVENIGGSFIRFTPPNNAGISFIIRIPVKGTFQTGDSAYPIPLEPIGTDRKITYGWDIDWFTVKKEDGEIDEDEGGSSDDENDPYGGCRKGAFVFNALGEVLSVPH